jgi:hypothetical protein
MLGATDRQIPLMRRTAGILGWLLVTLYFGIIVALNVGIVEEFYWPEGPWPGWAPLIEADLLYGAGGIAVMLAARWGWRRLMRPRLSPVKLA